MLLVIHIHATTPFFTTWFEPLTSCHITSHHLTPHHIASNRLTSPHLTSPHLTPHHITSHHWLGTPRWKIKTMVDLVSAT